MLLLQNNNTSKLLNRQTALTYFNYFGSYNTCPG